RKPISRRVCSERNSVGRWLRRWMSATRRCTVARSMPSSPPRKLLELLLQGLEAGQGLGGVAAPELAHPGMAQAVLQAHEAPDVADDGARVAVDDGAGRDVALDAGHGGDEGAE